MRNAKKNETIMRRYNKRAKLLGLVFVAAFLVLLFPKTTLADNYDVSGGEFSLNSCNPGDTVTIAPGATVELNGSATNTAVICGAGVTLTINNISIENYSTACPDGHVNKTPADSVNKFEFDSTNTVYGITADASWTGSDGGYFRLANLYYDANGGSGSIPPSAAQHVSTTATVASGDTLNNGDYVFDGWNTAANGTDTAYAANTVLAFSNDITLFAQWKKYTEPTPVPSAVITKTGDISKLPVLLIIMAGSVALVAITAAVIVFRNFIHNREDNEE